jgi:hypothetical protein
VTGLTPQEIDGLLRFACVYGLLLLGVERYCR